MSDTQAAMREFRFLDDKRKGGGLSPIEEHRWIDLGGQLGMTAQQGYYGPDGVWYVYPPGYDPQTGQYYQHQGYAPPPPQQYYDPNAGYYPPQQGYDPNAGYYDPNAPYDPNQQPPYDPNQQQPAYDPTAQAYPQQQSPYAPQQQWSQPEHPQAQGEWPQGYDPNTGQYYDASGHPQPSPSQPQYAAAQPEQQQEQAPAPVYEAPAAPVADDGPLEVAEDEVMEVTDDDVTLLDSSPPISMPMPAAPVMNRGFLAEKPLTAAPDADMFGDLRSSLSLDAPATAPTPVEVEPLLDASGVEPDLEIPVDLAPEPVDAAPSILAEVLPELIPADVVPEPVAAARSILADVIPAPMVATPEILADVPPSILADVLSEPIPADIVSPGAAAPSILADAVAEPIPVIPEPDLPPPLPVVAETAPVSILADIPEPDLPPPLPLVAETAPVSILADIPEPVATAPQPEIPIEPELREAVTPAIDSTIPSTLGGFAEPVLSAPEPAFEADQRPTIPDLSKLKPPDSVDAQAVVDPIPVPAVTIPDPAPIDVAFEPDIDEEPAEMPSIMVVEDLGAESFAAPAQSKSFGEEPELPPLNELSAMLGGSRPPPPPPPSAPDPDAPPFAPTREPQQGDARSDVILEPHPSAPISIQVEEPVQEESFDVDPILEASVEPELLAAPAPSFAASFDDIPMDREPDVPVSTHTGFEASLGDLPPAIANEPPPPIVDVDFVGAVPAVDFDVAIDDKPVAVETPTDLGGNAGDKLELAKTSDFLEFPASSSADTHSFSVEGESLVESETLAQMANPVAASAGRAPIELPADEADAGVPLASNADFLGMSELNNTGEAWTRRDASVSLEEPITAAVEEPEDIIEGVALEDDSLTPEIQADLVEAVIEPDLWPPPAAIAPPPARPLPPPGPVPFVPKPPAAAAPFSSAPPVRSSAVPIPVSAGRDHSLFETKGNLLRDEGGAPEILGEHRVILHTLEGQVKRGVLRDAKLDDDTVGLEAQPGAVERIPRPRIKAIFFMLPPGQKAPPPTGDKLRVTFKDGRQLAGFSSDHRGTGIGFFVVPADNRTNTERIFIYRLSVEKIAVD